MATKKEREAMRYKIKLYLNSGSQIFDVDEEQVKGLEGDELLFALQDEINLAVDNHVSVIVEKLA